ncbi:2-hydroxyglutaryl-CoA dehydratase D-componentHgdB2 [Striga asiatica]|uniref:2-hydroxyglutaryl-CoA dehydratase D-componentHgdB2 n=1 Tax=Striga asiatica TaxID=4170 RepID=A0A5A7R1I3_STRAF|nr:2-hydroxyglutaryl-CoA dehydratase D-componentHgdB2 [Striga asiatica]
MAKVRKMMQRNDCQGYLVLDQLAELLKNLLLRRPCSQHPSRVDSLDSLKAIMDCATLVDKNRSSQSSRPSQKGLIISTDSSSRAPLILCAEPVTIAASGSGD